MKQQHYCRTCGSNILSKDVCPHCGCDPLKGHNYCCDCGTSTVTEAIMCIHCGASLQKRFPVVLAILISIALAVSAAVAGYFIINHDNEEEQPKNIAGVQDLQNTKKTGDTHTLSPRKKDGPVKIKNNIPDKLLKSNDAISRLIKNLPRNLKPAVEPGNKMETPPKEEINPDIDKPVVPIKANVTLFSPGEVRSYGPICTYFQGRSKNKVVFFTTNVYGYLKINGKVYALQGMQKGNDIARFSGAGYEVTIEILGLAGDEKEWLAEATLLLRDVRQRTLSRHKIYSTCTDF